MKFFYDTTGKQWTIDVHVGAIELVKAACNIDLTKLFSDELKLLSELFDNPTTLTSVLWALCGSGDGKASFLAVMRGDELELAAKALVDDVIDFFPNQRRRELCRATVLKLWQTVEAGQDQLQQKLTGIDPTSLICATSSPGSSA